MWVNLLAMSEHGTEEYVAFAPIDSMVEKFSKLDVTDRVSPRGRVNCDGSEEE